MAAPPWRRARKDGKPPLIGGRAVSRRKFIWRDRSASARWCSSARPTAFIERCAAERRGVAQLQERLGVELPLDHLRFWLLGVPDPGGAFELKRNDQDRASQLTQADWNIDYDRLHAGGWRLTARAPGAPPRGCARAHRRRSLGAAAMNATRETPGRRARHLGLHRPNSIYSYILSADGPTGITNCKPVFQFVDLCDEITIEVRVDGRIRRAVELADVAEDADLCVRAARAAAKRCRLPPGRRHRVLKRIPWAAVWAAAVPMQRPALVALNHLWNLRWPVADLAALGLKLGADVPVFVRGRAAWAEGIGERLTPLYPPQAPFEAKLFDFEAEYWCGARRKYFRILN